MANERTDVGEAIRGTFTCGQMNAIDALVSIAEALTKLGLGNAGTSMGALEAHAKAIMDSGFEIADGLEHIGDGLYEVAKAIREK